MILTTINKIYDVKLVASEIVRAIIPTGEEAYMLTGVDAQAKHFITVISKLDITNHAAVDKNGITFNFEIGDYPPTFDIFTNLINTQSILAFNIIEDISQIQQE